MLHQTENGSDQTHSIALRTPGTIRRHRSGLSHISRGLLHVRASLRLSSRRSSFALSLILAAASTVGTAIGASVVATHLLHGAETHAAVSPLAPAPAPPTPPVEAAPRVHHRMHLPGNPLRGLASWYGNVWNGRKTASGETFDETKLTAAHKTLPLGTLVRVTNLVSMRSVIVRINDRGTLAPNRVIDLSSAAARELGLLEKGLGRVKLEIIGKA